MTDQPNQPDQTAFATADTSDIGQLSYEAAIQELVSIVNRLEAGQTSLEESLALWERGEALANRCESWLNGAQQRLDQVRAQVQGDSGDDATGQN